MKRSLIFVGILLTTLLGSAILMVGCQGEIEGPTEAVPTIEEQPLVAVEVPLTTLLRNPYTFEDELIQISGQYKQLPLMVCRTDPHLSPATWALVDGPIEIAVAGFDTVLRQLGDDEGPLIVEGYWQFWDGPVGCGRRAPEKEIWHLQVSRIISPNPLSIASVVDQPLVEIQEETPISGPMIEVTEVAVPRSSTPFAQIPTATPLSISTATVLPAPSNTQEATATPLSSPTSPTATPSDVRTNTPEPTVEGEVTNTPTATATQTEPGPTSTATSTRTPSPTETSTSTPGGGTLAYERIVRGEIGIEGVHFWNFEALEYDIISVSVGPSTGLDLALELIDPDGMTISVKNDEPAGHGESLGKITLEISGEFEVAVRAVGGTSGNYSVVLTNNDSETFLDFKENLVYGGIGTGNLPESTDHLWDFEAISGDVVTIEIDPASVDDMVLFLIAPDSTELIFVDENGPGDGEQIVSYVITEDGIYSIRVGELEFQPASYTVTLDAT